MLRQGQVRLGEAWYAVVGFGQVRQGLFYVRIKTSF